MISLFYLALVVSLNKVFLFVSDGELNVLEDLLTEAPDQDDELYNPESERDVSDKKGTDTTVITTVTAIPSMTDFVIKTMVK